MASKTCGTCLHWQKWQDEAQGKPGDYYHGKVMGTCNAPLPNSVVHPEDLPMAENDKDCPCWTEKK